MSSNHYQTTPYRISAGPEAYGLDIEIGILSNLGPINNQQLQKMYQVLMSSLAENKRVVVFRFDLNLPQGKDLPIYQNYHLTQFTNSLKSQLQAQHQRKLRNKIRTYKPSLRYAWVQEQKTSHNPHYHFFITL